MAGHQNIIGMNQTGLTAYNSTNGVVYANTITASNGVAVTNGGGGSTSPDIQGTSATASAVGVAKFPTADFVVTSGSVALEAGRRQTSLSYSNLGVTYSAGTFTICGFDSTALSATNPAYIFLQSNANPGRTLQFTVTANQTFVDHAGSSTISGNLFGFTTSVAITTDVPFYLYACAASDGTTITFGLSRCPHLTVAPAAGIIGKPTSAVASTQGGLFLFSNVTVANYAAQPIICIGSIRMQMTSGNDWTVQTLSTTDGIGTFQQGITFTTPLGQFGADSGTYCLANGGTAAVFSTYQSIYTVFTNGSFRHVFALDGDAGTDGSGAVTAEFSVPFATDQQSAVGNIIGWSQVAGGSHVTGLVGYSSPTANTAAMQPSGGAVYQWSSFANGARQVSWDGVFTMSKQ